MNPVMSELISYKTVTEFLKLIYDPYTAQMSQGLMEAKADLALEYVLELKRIAHAEKAADQKF